MGCDDLKLKKIHPIKLCCGRNVSQAQVCSLFEERPALEERPACITQQFNYCKARVVLLLLLPQSEKHDHTYTQKSMPLISGCGGGKQFIAKSKVTSS
jgi:hypothetical protein